MKFIKRTFTNNHDVPYVTLSGHTTCTTETGGISDVLRQVELNIIPNITCVENFSAISIVIRDDVICTFKGPTGTESTCSGDSGGPLMVRRSVVVRGLLVNCDYVLNVSH